MDGFGEEACLKAFEPYVGLPYEESVFVFGLISPSAETWENGDREVICLFYDGSGTTMTDSARGSRQ